MAYIYMYIQIILYLYIYTHISVDFLLDACASLGGSRGSEGRRGEAGAGVVRRACERVWGPCLWVSL